MTQPDIATVCREYTDPDGFFRPFNADELAALEARIGHDPDMLAGPARGVKWRGPLVPLADMTALSSCVLRAAMTAPLDDAREMRRVVHEAWFTLSRMKWRGGTIDKNAWHAAHRTAMGKLWLALPENRAALNAGLAHRAGKQRQKQKGLAKALELRDRVQALMTEKSLTKTAACEKIDGGDTGTTRKKLTEHGLFRQLGKL